MEITEPRLLLMRQQDHTLVRDLAYHASERDLHKVLTLEGLIHWRCALTYWKRDRMLFCQHNTQGRSEACGGSQMHELKYLATPKRPMNGLSSFW